MCDFPSDNYHLRDYNTYWESNGTLCVYVRFNIFQYINLLRIQLKLTLTERVLILTLTMMSVIALNPTMYKISLNQNIFLCYILKPHIVTYMICQYDPISIFSTTVNIHFFCHKSRPIMLSCLHVYMSAFLSWNYYIVTQLQC